MDSSKVQEVLAQTLAPDPALIKQATGLLETYRQQPGYGIALLQVVNEASAPPYLRQQAAVQFKNLVRFQWTPSDDSEYVGIEEGEKHEIRTHVVQIMMSAPEKVRVQVSEALTIISDTDFPGRWPTLLPALLEKMEGAVNSNTNVGGVDVDVLKGVLGTLESVFKRFRGQYIDTIAKDLEYVQQVIAPLLRVAGVLTAQVVASGGREVVAVEDATSLLSVFYSLNSPGLTAEFEDHLAAWMDCIHKLLVLPTAAPAVDDDDEAPVDACKAMACECLSLFMERNEEEFAGFLETFVESVWKQLVEVGPGVGQDRLAMAAISFLTTVARSVHFGLFKGEEILKQVCQGVVIPNIRLRDGDVELFEMNWVEYVRRDAEGSDSETRRRAASELVKALVEKFPGETTQLFSGYVGALLAEAAADPAGKWQAKDAAMYLVTALAAKTKTSAAGATTTNELVNLNEFYANHVAPELEGATASSEDRAVIKADCLRFVTVFRAQLAKETLLGMFPKCVSLLSCTNNVVHSYAATLVERLLSMKAPGAAGADRQNQQNQFSPAEVGPYLQQILEKLFGALKMPDSGENEYVMRAIMRLIVFVGTAVGPVMAAALTELSNILGMVARNPTQPGFNHYLFEAIAALVKFGCDGTEAGMAGVEGVLFPPFQIILQEDVQEFHPYVFQIFAQMIEKRASGAAATTTTAVIPEAYMQLLQPLLTPHFWERTGNIPALGRLVRSFIRASPKQIEQHVQGILGVFQKLVAMKSQDHEGMYILDALLVSMDAGVLAQYLGSVWQVVYQRLTAAKTTKFCKSFMYTGSLLAALRGGDAAGQSMDSVQPGILLMVVQNVWAPSLAQKGVLPSEKVALVGSTRLLTEAAVLQSPGAAPAAAALLHAISMRCMGGSGVDGSLDDLTGAAAGDEFAGYSAAYAKLLYSSSDAPDLLPGVSDAKVDVVERLRQYNASHGGRLSALGGSLDEERAAVVAAFFKQAGLTL